MPDQRCSRPDECQALDSGHPGGDDGESHPVNLTASAAATVASSKRRSDSSIGHVIDVTSADE
jgi:hypothetical protein